MKGFGFRVSGNAGFSPFGRTWSAPDYGLKPALQNPNPETLPAHVRFGIPQSCLR
jgi:hypothetical protein